MSEYSYRFELDKAIQAVSVLLEQSEEQSCNYYRLIKMLYIADMVSIKESGYPITGSKPYAMKHGPVLSEIYDEIKDNDTDKWNKYIETEGYKIRLKRDPGKEKLSPFEKEKLKKVWEDNKEKDGLALKKETHEFYEHQNNAPEGNTSNPIPLSDILNAPRMDLGEYQEEIEKMAEETHELT